MADIPVSGKFSGKGSIEYRLSGGEWLKAEIQDGTFSGVVKGVPVGGPYVMEIRIIGKDGEIQGNRRVPGLLVGDLWIMAGQSNMDGCGLLVDVEPPSRMVCAYYYDESWGIAKDPLCRLDESIDPVHWTITDPKERAAFIYQNRTFCERGAGLGVRFGKDLYKATGIPVGLLMCSHGGTDMNQWSPALKDMGGESLYGSMMRRVNAAGGKVAGCLWYQGENDAVNGIADDHEKNLRGIIESLRKDLKSPKLPFIYAQLACYHNWQASAESVRGWDVVRNAQLALESKMENIAMVSTTDCSLSDPVHLDARSQRRLGARMALMARKLLFGEDQIPLGPRPVSYEFVDSARTTLRVKYSEVNSGLRPASSIMGFSIWNGEKRLEIKRCNREAGDPSSVLIRTAQPVPNGAELWYGRGINPTCNLVDAAGFAAPVFGPVKL